MIVMRVLVVMLVKRAPVMKLKLAREAALFQQLQRAINGCKSYRRVFSFNNRVEVFARYMPFGVEKNVQYQIALRGSLQSLALEVIVEDLNLFALHRSPARIDYTQID